MVTAFPIWLSLVTSALATPAVGPARPARFLSTLQIAVHEPSPALLRRSQRLTRNQFAAVFESVPELEGTPYQVRTLGNELVFTVLTNDDRHAPMQVAVEQLIQSLNGRVRAKGRSLYYRTNAEPQGGAFLDVSLDATGQKVASISAQSAPLWEVLRALRYKLGSLSYLVPGECGERLVNWSFGESADGPVEPRDVTTIMGDLASVLGLRSENRGGMYVFVGNCPPNPTPSHGEMESAQLILPPLLRPPSEVLMPVVPVSNDW